MQTSALIPNWHTNKHTAPHSQTKHIPTLYRGVKLSWRACCRLAYWIELAHCLLYGLVFAHARYVFAATHYTLSTHKIKVKAPFCRWCNRKALLHRRGATSRQLVTSPLLHLIYVGAARSCSRRTRTHSSVFFAFFAFFAFLGLGFTLSGSSAARLAEPPPAKLPHHHAVRSSEHIATSTC